MNFCRWIEETIKPVTQWAYMDDKDRDGEPDLIVLADRLDGTFSLKLELSGSGSEAFLVDIDEPSSISSMLVENFGGGRASLVFVDAGSLESAALFEDGPAPTFADATAGVYDQIASVRLNDDSMVDLVAQRKDGQIDAFTASATGFQLNAAIHPLALNLDHDEHPDFVWLSGALGLHSYSSERNRSEGNGHTFRPVNAPGITLDSLDAGKFRALPGEEREDMITLGQGVLIWCTSNGSGAVVCHQALDAPFYSPGRTATEVLVQDTNFDGLDDLVVTYADSSEKTILARPNGFPVPQGQTPAKSHDAVGATPTPQGIATFGFDASNFQQLITVFDEVMEEIESFFVDVPLLPPLAFAPGNFNDDGAIGAAALVDGQTPFGDLAVLSGGDIFALISNGDGTYAANVLEGDGDFVAIEATDVTGDGIDDLSATRADGSVTVFSGIPGTGQGLTAVGENFTGLPTAESSDGKLLVLSGLGVDTVGTTQMRMRLRVGAGDTAALDHLNVQVFDGNNGGLHQFDEESSLLKTCYRLSADPCGDGNSGNCSGGPIQPIPLTTVSSDAFGDDQWDTIYNGPHSPLASLTGDGQPPLTYELRIYLSQDCATIPAPGSQLSVATADAFKIRANAMVSQPLGEFSIVGSDGLGDFGVEDLPYMPDTSYDGTFSLPISVGSSATEIQLKESDADDTEDSTRGVSLGANPQIQYRLLKPDGSAANVTGFENTTASPLVTNPSGNNDGQTALDVETRTHVISGSGVGPWTWQWENVMASNAIHLFSPFGSPTTHEVMGAWRARPTVSSAQQPTSWRSNLAALQAELPVVLGNEWADGQVEGTGLVIDNASVAQTILDNASNDLRGELERQLLTAKLNWQRGLVLGEDIKGALVYGRTKAVRSVINEADAIVSGVDGLADEARLTDLVTLLSAINLGEINYQQPGVPFPDEPMVDDDGDGFVNLKDNCPSIPNPLQEDTDDDWIGDACHVTPLAVCVLERSQTEREAVLGYDNPLSFRGVPHGTKNALSYNGQQLWESAQPTELGYGAQLDAFRYRLGWGDTLSWTLDGETVVVDDTTPPCSGRELTNVALAPRTALYAAERIVIGERSSVTASGDELASIVSGGDVVLEASSSVENVLAAGRAVVREYAAIRGAAPLRRVSSGSRPGSSMRPAASCPARIPLPGGSASRRRALMTSPWALRNKARSSPVTTAT
ncbi:MAG TPA: hypothetical protein VJN18_12350 [Polyangiaceae bacterium]|nr:hypothetical protein [Polyangiaceae bacterium]